MSHGVVPQNIPLGHRHLGVPSPGAPSHGAPSPGATVPWGHHPMGALWDTIPWGTIPWGTIPWGTIPIHLFFDFLHQRPEEKMSDQKKPPDPTAILIGAITDVTALFGLFEILRQRPGQEKRYQNNQNFLPGACHVMRSVCKMHSSLRGSQTAILCKRESQCNELYCDSFCKGLQDDIVTSDAIYCDSIC